MILKRSHCTFLTSCLCDRWVGGGLHRHGRGRSIADGGRREISKTCLSSHRLPARTTPIAERVLDNGLAKVESGTSQSTSKHLIHNIKVRLCMSLYVFTCFWIITIMNWTKIPSLHLLQSHSTSTHLCNCLRGSCKRCSRDDADSSSPVSCCF